MAKYDLAPYAKINGNAYRDWLTAHPKAQKITLTRGQLEAIIRDLCDYTDRDADATAWAEQATRSAARIAELETELLVARGMAVVQRILDASPARPAPPCGAGGGAEASGQGERAERGVGRE